MAKGRTAHIFTFAKGGRQTLTQREITIILAALLFWREEMCPHDPAIMQPYFETVGLPNVEPLSADEIIALSQRLRAQLPI